jgi:DNA-directed RNA polymerase subunit A'
MIISVMPVAPPSIRPAIQMESTQRAEDDLTHQYTSILKINKKMKEMIDKGLP